jgi:hypothetical protein
VSRCRRCSTGWTARQRESIARASDRIHSSAMLQTGRRCCSAAIFVPEVIMCASATQPSALGATITARLGGCLPEESRSFLPTASSSHSVAVAAPLVAPCQEHAPCPVACRLLSHAVTAWLHAPCAPDLDGRRKPRGVMEGVPAAGENCLHLGGSNRARHTLATAPPGAARLI